MKNNALQKPIWPLAALLCLALIISLQSFAPGVSAISGNGENWWSILIVYAAVVLVIIYLVLDIRAKRPTASGWVQKLDAIIAKFNLSATDTSSPTKITIEDLPTAAEIVRDPANHALLREKLERLNYLFLDHRLSSEDKSRDRLKRFIENYERELAKAERNKQVRSVPLWAWVRLLSVAVLWVAASWAPMMVDHLAASSNASGDETKVKDGVTNKTDNKDRVTNKTNNKQDTGEGIKILSLTFNSDSRSLEDKQPAAWLRILISVAFICIYLAFYAVLTVALFKMAKSLRQYYRQKRLQENLSSLTALLAVRIDREDTARQQLKDRILRILISDDSEE